MASAVLPLDQTSDRQLLARIPDGALFAALAVVALLIRLGGLGAGPLTPTEVTSALAAHHLAQGSPSLVAQWGQPVPSLLAPQTLSLYLLGSGDLAARLPVAILSALTPLAFMALRRQLGGRIALLAAALLTVSPGWTALGVGATAAGLAGPALLISTALVARHAAAPTRRTALMTGAAIAFAAGAGPEAALGLLLLGAAYSLARPGDGLPLWRTVTVTALGFGLALYTVAMLYPPSLQAFAESLARLPYLITPRPGAVLLPALLTLAAEPLLLLLGLGTLVLPAAHRAPRWLLSLLVVALALTLLLGDPTTGWSLLLPTLAILAAHTLRVGLAAAYARPHSTWVETLGLGAVVVTYGALALASYARQGETIYLFLGLTALGIAVVLSVALVLRDGFRPALVSLAALATLIALLLSLGGTLRLPASETERAATAPARAIPLPGITDLVEDVAAVGWSRAGFLGEAELVATRDLGPQVAWALRHETALTWLEALPSAPTAHAIVTAGDHVTLVSGSYVGQDYAVSARWQPAFAQPAEFLRWLLYHEVPPAALQTERVTLWVQADALPAP